MNTLVKFKMFKGNVIAIFPKELWNEELYGNTMLLSYSLIGQHGACHKDLLKCRNAKPKQYEKLRKELESIGYNLAIGGEIK